MWWWIPHSSTRWGASASEAGAPAARLPKQRFRPPFSKGGRARARGHSRPLGWLVRRRYRPQRCASKVFVHLFQKVADSKGSAFGRWPQPAEHSILQAYLGVWGPLQEKGPQGPSFLRPLGGKRPPRWGGGPAGARGGPSYLFAACGRPAGSPSSFFLLEFSGSLRKRRHLPALPKPPPLGGG